MQHDSELPPERNYNTLRIGLLGLGVAAVLLSIFLSIAIPLLHSLNIPAR